MYRQDLSDETVITIRRISWAMGLSMRKAIDVFLNAALLFINKEKVCELCEDCTKCASCGIKHEKEIPEKALDVLYLSR
jgi:hypothetical protein